MPQPDEGQLTGFGGFGPGGHNRENTGPILF